MAKMTSRRVMDQRQKNSDRIGITVPKEARHLIRAQALREGVSYAEMIRRAILARCGLELWPNFSDPHYNFVVAAGDKESADEAVEGLQLDEYVERHQKKKNADVFMTVMLSSQGMKEEYTKALMDLMDALNGAKSIPGKHDQIKLSERSVLLLYRLLSNIDKIPEQDDDDAVG